MNTTTNMNEIHSCEVCGATNLRSVLDLGPHPMCDDLVPVGSDRYCKQYPIEILFCDTCITAHQRYQIPKNDLFPRSYHYRSRHTADVLRGMEDLVGSCENQVGSLKSKVVLDIGCNDGSLLCIFAARGASTFGVEPTGAAEEAANRGHAVIDKFFSEVIAEDIVRSHGHPDIITFTNVFAHIEDLRSLLRGLRILLGPTTLLAIENHYLGAILEKDQFDTFYHEHPRTYSYTSFEFIAKALGLHAANVEFPRRYGGNIRVFMLPTTGNSYGNAELREKERAFGPQLSEMVPRIERWKSRKLSCIREEVQRRGPIPAKAFPGRAAILIKLLGLDNEMISAVYEKPGSAKVGHYVPGTRIPIRSDDEFPLKSENGPILNLAWHISDEISQYMRKIGYTGRIIDIVSAEDFVEL